MRPVAILALAAVFCGGCGAEPREPEPLEIDTVEVGDAVDVGLSTESDEKGRPPPGDDWILTGMLPEDLPLHRPARLVDSGDSGDGRRFFVFHSSTPLETVRTGLERRLAAAGWSAEPVGGGLAAAKGSERVDFELSELRPGTEIRVTY